MQFTLSVHITIEFRCVVWNWPEKMYNFRVVLLGLFEISPIFYLRCTYCRLLCSLSPWAIATTLKLFLVPHRVTAWPAYLGTDSPAYSSFIRGDKLWMVTVLCDCLSQPWLNPIRRILGSIKNTPREVYGDKGRLHYDLRLSSQVH